MNELSPAICDLAAGVKAKVAYWTSRVVEFHIETIRGDVGDLDALMREMMAFRDSQRLFCAALSGRLGEHFPIGRLAAMMSAIPAGPSLKTAGWEALGVGLGAGSQVERSVISQIDEFGGQGVLQGGVVIWRISFGPEWPGRPSVNGDWGAQEQETKSVLQIGYRDSFRVSGG